MLSPVMLIAPRLGSSLHRMLLKILLPVALCLIVVAYAAPAGWMIVLFSIRLLVLPADASTVHSVIALMWLLYSRLLRMMLSFNPSQLSALPPLMPLS